MQQNKRLTAAGLILIMLLTLLTGCGEKDTSGSDPTAKGRYLETELYFPFPLFSASTIYKSPGNVLKLVCTKDIGGGKTTLTLLQSVDEGKTWTEEKASWMDDIDSSADGYSIHDTAWTSDGGIYIACDISSNGTGETRSTMLYVDRAGLVSDLTYDLPSDSGGSGVKSMRLADNGDLLIDCFFSLIQIDAQTGAVKHTFAPANAEVLGDYLPVGNQVSIIDGAFILTYDLETGKQAGETPCSQGAEIGTDVEATVLNNVSVNDKVLASAADGSLYFADTRGLFHFTPGSAVLEKMVDGNLNSLSAPAYQRIKMIAFDDSFLVMSYIEDSFVLLSYAYSPDVQTVPETELTVYSLEDNLTVRQAIGAFQRQNPNAYVRYQVGISDGTLKPDALRTLTTELLTGKGPDVLVLDGLPLQSYIEKGALADLSPDIDRLIKKEALAEHPAESFRQPDGKLYAVPARFSVPMMQGSQDAIDSIHSLSDMVSWLEENRSAYVHPLVSSWPTALLEQLYPLCETEMTGKNGAIQKEALTTFLSDIKKIVDLDAQVPAPVQPVKSFQYQFGALNWQKDAVGLNIGNVKDFYDIFAPEQAIKDKAGGGKAAPLFNRRSFLPGTILGVNARSSQSELARTFVSFTLSDEIQKFNFQNGLPVSKTLLEQHAQYPDGESEGARSTHYGTSFIDRDGTETSLTMSTTWPSQAFLKAAVEQFEAMDQPICADPVLLQLLIDNTPGYFTGKISLESTVDQLMKKIELYQAE